MVVAHFLNRNRNRLYWYTSGCRPPPDKRIIQSHRGLYSRDVGWRSQSAVELFSVLSPLLALTLEYVYILHIIITTGTSQHRNSISIFSFLSAYALSLYCLVDMSAKTITKNTTGFLLLFID